MSKVLDYRFWETKVNPITGYKVTTPNDTIYIASSKLREKIRAKADDSPIEERGLGVGRKKNAKGYFFCKQTKKYVSLIRVNGVKYKLGSFDNPEDAGKAYKDFLANIHNMNV